MTQDELNRQLWRAVRTEHDIKVLRLGRLMERALKRRSRRRPRK